MTAGTHAPVRLAVTCGDPAGVGPEIIADWLGSPDADTRHVTVFGPARWLSTLALHGATASPVGPPAYEATPGIPSVEGAQVALAAMEGAAAGTSAGAFDAVVTGPVSKTWLQRAGYPFPGQTEFFADRWGGEPTMAFCGGRLRVALLTWHIPLKAVPGQLSPDAFQRAVAAAETLALACGPVGPVPPGTPPRIAVCGLNPHAGEDGLLGTEEIEIIDPILDRLRTRYPGLSRTQPPDTVFARQLRGEFDAVVAIYHDQGLAPLKTIDFDASVNVTLGLPFVRTSPDHGTAFGIAGQGRANPASFTQAIAVARLLAGLRRSRPQT